MSRVIFHVDVNSAFLSWEAAKRVKEGLPDLREIPSCIGGDPKLRRSIVVAKSIPAKKYGVTTGEPVALALRKCPDLVCVPGDFALYQRCSRAFKEICASYAPAMESFSIDEVFLDMIRHGKEFYICTENKGPNLSSREKEILAYIVKGFNNKQISELIYLSENTIKTYRKRLMIKIGAKNAADLVFKGKDFL